MRRRRHGAIVYAALLAGCVDSSGPENPLAGTWVATQFTITPVGSGQLNVLTLGGSLTIVIAADNSTSGSLDLPANVTGGAQFNASMAGTAVLSNSSTEVTFTQSADTFVRDLTWQRVGDTSLRVNNQVAGNASFTVTLTKR